MSIRTRLTLWYAAVLAVSLAVFSVLLYTTLDYVNDADVDTSLADKAEDVARTLRLRGELSFLPKRATLPQSNSLTGPAFYVQLLDPNGKVVDRSDSLGDDTLPIPPDSLESGRQGLPVHESMFVSGQEVRLYTVPVQVQGQLVGFIQVGRSLHFYNQTLGWLRNLLIGIDLAMVLVASGVGYLLARAALRPINRVTQAARAIGLSQRLDRRLQPYSYRDEIGELIATFNQMLDRLDSASRAQRRFVSDASHELRTPLTTIRGNVEMLRKGKLGPADQVDSLTDISDEADRMSRIIAGLLALARADAGRKIECALVNLDNLVQDVYRQARVLAPPDVTVELGTVEPVEALADADYLRQLLLILIENALKYNRPGGSVRISLAREGDWLRIEVSDTGAGIAPADLPHVFERFYRSSTARPIDGTGLGLALAQWIAEQHGGLVEGTSVLGQGSTFTFRLPSIHARPGPRQPTHSPPDELAKPPNLFDPQQDRRAKVDGAAEPDRGN